MSEAKGKRDWTLIIIGIIMLICSGAIAAFPGLALITIAAFAGAAFLVSGIGNVVSYLQLRKTGNASAWTLLYAAIDVIIGLMMLLHPIANAAVIPWLIAVCFIVLGGFEIAAALKMRKVKVSAWGWVCVSAIVNVLCGIMLLTFPAFLAALLSIMVAIRGVGLIVFGFAVGKLEIA